MFYNLEQREYFFRKIAQTTI